MYGVYEAVCWGKSKELKVEEKERGRKGWRDERMLEEASLDESSLKLQAS